MSKNALNSGKEGAFTRDIREIINHNFADIALSTSQLDVVSSTTLVNIPGLVTDTLDPGATYKFKAKLPMVCTANNGSKIAFKQGAASMIKSIEYQAKAFTAAGVPVVSRGTTVTDQTLIMDNPANVVILVEIQGVVVIDNTAALVTAKANGTLTLQLQAAEHTSHADTMSVFLNAEMEFDRILPAN